MNRLKVETRLFGVLRWVVVVALAIATLFPFYYMVLLSVRSQDALLRHPGDILPKAADFTFDTYRRVLRAVSEGGDGLLSFLGNSALVSVATVLVTLVVSIPGAYAASRLRFAGRKQVHYLFLAVYLFPTMLLAIPLFVVFSRAGLRDSLVGLLIVYVAQAVPVSIYMLRNYLSTIPESIEEAAAIDGLGRLGTMWRISLPLAAPSIVATGLYVFMIAWNEFLFALLFLVEDRTKWTVSLGLSQLAGGLEVPKTVLMAGSVVLTVPIVVMFYAAQRMLAEGLTSGAEKG